MEMPALCWSIGPLNVASHCVFLTLPLLERTDRRLDGWMYGVADKQPMTGHINGLQLPCCFVCLSADWRLMEYHQSMFVWAIIYRTRSPDNDYASLEFLLYSCRSLLVCPFAFHSSCRGPIPRHNQLVVYYGLLLFSSWRSPHSPTPGRSPTNNEMTHVCNL